MEIELKNDPTYTLSQTLDAHQSAVRCLNYGNSHLISGSTDKHAKLFQLEDNKYVMINQMDFYQNYIYSVCCRFEGGFAVASGNTIYIHDQEGNPCGMLEGHTGQVCSLSSQPGYKLISGSWDATAIVWNVSSFTQIYKFEGHKYAVCVIACQEEDEFITGSQDGILRYWVKGQKISSKEAHSDIVREISLVPGIGYVTCSNDETIKLWSKQLDHLGTFLGHTGFIFSVKTLNTSNGLYYVSASDDNSVRLWKGLGDQVQTINHPGCVWTVCINSDNGDIISGCVDGKIRVFTFQTNRHASPAEIEQYQKEVELVEAQGPEGLSEATLNKMLPVEQMGSVKGKKNGEVKLFRNGNKPEVYGWDEANQKWDKIGDVLGGSNKKQFHGDQYFPAGEYDYVFDVDDDSGVPKLIPLNEGDSHLEVAEKFCKREGYNKGYLQQILNFLRQNTRPVEQKQVTTQQQKFQYIPFTSSFFYENMNMAGLQKKLLEFNAELLKEENPLALTEFDLNSFNGVIQILSSTSFYHTSKIDSTQIQIIGQKLIKWPSKYLLPVYDFLRIFELHHSSEKLFSGLDSGLNIFTEMGVHMQAPNQTPVFIRVCLHVLCNLFKHNSNQYAALRHMSIVFETLQCPQILGSPDQKNNDILADIILNYSIAIYQTKQLPNDVGQIFSNLIVQYFNIQIKRDPAPVSKILTAIGNLSQCGDLSIRKSVKLALSGISFNNSCNEPNNENLQNILKEVQVSLNRI